MVLRNKLLGLRERRELSQQGLATIAGTSPSTVNRIERWGYVPTAPVQERLARALNVPIHAIWPELSGEDRAA